VDEVIAAQHGQEHDEGKACEPGASVVQRRLWSSGRWNLNHPRLADDDQPGKQQDR
jgi:hypothetical protein